jgi:hypothetical protein
MGAKEHFLMAFFRVASLNLALRRSRPAARLFAAFQAMREEMKIPVSVIIQAELDRSIAQVRTRLGQKNFEAEWRAGLDMETAEAAEYALAATSYCEQIACKA